MSSSLSFDLLSRIALFLSSSSSSFLKSNPNRRRRLFIFVILPFCFFFVVYRITILTMRRQFFFLVIVDQFERVIVIVVAGNACRRSNSFTFHLLSLKDGMTTVSHFSSFFFLYLLWLFLPARSTKIAANVAKRSARKKANSHATP